VDVVVLEPGADLEALSAHAVAGGADTLGIAGGDGSLATVADVAMAHEIPFVCIPAGTRNHFALDVGVDRRDLVGALDAFTDGVERRIDVARVNGKVFLNNVSLGIYGDAVQSPDYRDAKLRTLMTTAQAVLGPAGAAPELRLVDDRDREHTHPAVVVISNNPYLLGRPVVAGTRPSLTSGQLGILVLDRPDEAARAHREPGRAWTATSFRLDAPLPVQAGLDGEAVTLPPPLDFVIQPAALRVRISSRHPGLSPAGMVSG
jgi:diacylglycerol kinase family enzyme